LITKTIFYNIIDRKIGSIACLDFELLRAFVAVADCGGFHRAAERLNLTQSTVSQQIKRLELETKRPLFRRTTRRVALTDDGEMLLGDARRLLQLEEAARHRLAAPQLSGTVRLGVVEEVAGGSLPPALGRFAKLRARRRRPSWWGPIPVLESSTSPRETVAPPRMPAAHPETWFRRRLGSRSIAASPTACRRDAIRC
jgi:DNA-binding MarR family transcriptional regulator